MRGRASTRSGARRLGSGVASGRIGSVGLVSGRVISIGVASRRV
jgi:hypothetical protein